MIILGITIQHDSGAAIIKDGRILAAVNEERLNREKFFWGEPYKSIKEVMKLSKVKAENIDYVAVSNIIHGGPPVLPEEKESKEITADIFFGSFDKSIQLLEKLSKMGIGRILVGTKFGVYLFRLVFGRFGSPSPRIKKLSQFIKSMGIEAPVEFIDHHLAHISSAYFTSGWDRCLAVSLDAAGDGWCSKIGICKDGKIKTIKQIPFYHSPGYYYAYVTFLLLNFKKGQEGKTTGLAAYGDPEATRGIFKERIDYFPKRHSFINKGWWMKPEYEFLKERLAGYRREDVAAGIQEHLEEMVTAQVEEAIKETGLSKVVLAGGVFANVKLNQRISEIEGVEEIFIHPNMGDGGLGVGAALSLWAKKETESGNMPESSRLPNVYLGPSFSDQEIEEELKREDIGFEKVDDIEERIARYLSNGKVVARFEGRMEYGPRALGNRSILYQPTDPTVNDWLNKRLKRTEFMPFAPVVLEEKASEYFINYNKSSYAAEFMTVTFDVTERCKKEAPAIVHVDGTARPQVITEEINPSYYRILKEYEKLTGLPIMINTSFNIHEEPIVCTPYDAVRAFKISELDILAIGNFIVGERI